MVRYHRMYQKKGRKITFLIHLPQCSVFFRFYIINSRHSPTDKIKGFYSADRKWKLTAAKSLGPCGSTRLESVNSGKHRSKIKMWANHGVCHNDIYWNYPMRRYSFNPRFFLWITVKYSAGEFIKTQMGLICWFPRFRFEKCKCKTLNSHHRERLLKREKTTFGSSYFTFFFC